MSLKEMIPALVDHIKEHEFFIHNNYEALDIFKGNLEPRIKKVMKESLSDSYYSQIESRIIALNILQRLIDKLSMIYSLEPERVASEPVAQEMIDFYSRKFNIDSFFQRLEEYKNLHKGFSLEPFAHEGNTYLRSIPFSKFLPYTEDKVLDNRMTVYIKFLGTKGTTKFFRAYDNEQWVEFTDDKEFVNADFFDQGEIPFQYETIEPEDLIPTPDTDMVSLTKMIPVVLSDLGGAIMFQCFTIIYGVDISEANFKMSPNAFWDIKSDAAASDKAATIGTIKPEVDSDKVLEFIKSIFTMWLESKGLKVGNSGSVDVSSMSGISKIIDEIDTLELKKVSMRFFEGVEERFWKFLARTHNYWINNGLVADDYEFRAIVPEEFDFMIAYPEPEVRVSRKELVESVVSEVNNGLMSKFSAIKKLHPEMEDEQVLEELQRIQSEKQVMVISDGEEIPETDQD